MVFEFFFRPRTQKNGKFSPPAVIVGAVFWSLLKSPKTVFCKNIAVELNMLNGERSGYIIASKRVMVGPGALFFSVPDAPLNKAGLILCPLPEIIPCW